VTRVTCIPSNCTLKPRKRSQRTIVPSNLIEGFMAVTVQIDGHIAQSTGGGMVSFQ
jgi:hypothetical protein